MTEKVAEVAAHLDRKPPRTALASFVLENYGDGAGLLATTPDVSHARALFALAAQAELEALITETAAERPLVISA